MAATGWIFVVEFDGDASKLLSTLHANTWERSRFEFPYGETDFLDQIDFFSADEDERNEMVDLYGLRPLLHIAEQIGFDNFFSWHADRTKSGHVNNLEELRAMQCISADGTHSPLDIIGLSDRPEDFKLCPLTNEQIVKVFGKSQVNATDVNETQELHVASKIPDAYKRWQAVYCPLYTDGSITHAYVEGASGD